MHVQTQYGREEKNRKIEFPISISSLPSRKGKMLPPPSPACGQRTRSSDRRAAGSGQGPGWAPPPGTNRCCAPTRARQLLTQCLQFQIVSFPPFFPYFFSLFFSFILTPHSLPKPHRRNFGAGKNRAGDASDAAPRAAARPVPAPRPTCAAMKERSMVLLLELSEELAEVLRLPLPLLLLPGAGGARGRGAGTASPSSGGRGRGTDTGTSSSSGGSRRGPARHCPARHGRLLRQGAAATRPPRGAGPGSAPAAGGGGGDGERPLLVARQHLWDVSSCRRPGTALPPGPHRLQGTRWPGINRAPGPA